MHPLLDEGNNIALDQTGMVPRKSKKLPRAFDHLGRPISFWDFHAQILLIGEDFIYSRIGSP